MADYADAINKLLTLNFSIMPYVLIVWLVGMITRFFLSFVMGGKAKL